MCKSAFWGKSTSLAPWYSLLSYNLQLSKLKGPEALNERGTEGQTLMINRSGTVEVYQYSGGDWQNLGLLSLLLLVQPLF